MSNAIPTKNARAKRFVVSDFEGKIEANLSSIFSSSLCHKQKRLHFIFKVNAKKNKRIVLR